MYHMKSCVAHEIDTDIEELSKFLLVKNLSET